MDNNYITQNNESLKTINEEMYIPEIPNLKIGLFFADHVGGNIQEGAK